MEQSISEMRIAETIHWAHDSSYISNNNYNLTNKSEILELLDSMQNVFEYTDEEKEQICERLLNEV